MSLIVLSWNSFGDRANEMWNDLRFQAEIGGADDVLVFVSEASTPPWITPGLLKIAEGHEYRYSVGQPSAGKAAAPWFNATYPNGIASGIRARNAARKARSEQSDAWWVPWQVYVNVPPSLRCTPVLYWFPGAGSKRTIKVVPRPLVTHAYAGRPVLTVATKFGESEVTLLFAHMPSGLTNAKVALPELALLASKVYGKDSPMMLMGDLNLNAFKDTVAEAVLQKMEFSASLTGEQTQNRGGQLDWGAYNEVFGRLGTPATPTLLWRCRTDPSVNPPTVGPTVGGVDDASDHAMVRWVFD